MVNMSAKFDEDASQGSVTIMLRLFPYMSMVSLPFDLQNQLEWGCPNGTKYPPRQPIQTPQVMRLKSFYLTARLYLTARASTDRRTDRQTDRVIPVYPPP